LLIEWLMSDVGKEGPAPRAPRVVAKTVDRVREASAIGDLGSWAKPWYFDAPRVLLTCFQVTLAPLGLAIRAAEAAVSLAVLAVIGVGAGWYMGMITDQDVIQHLRPVGQRILAMVQQAGGLP
jgi:hypothetical protein